MHGKLQPYAVDHWTPRAVSIPDHTPLQTLTPPTSLAALHNGLFPKLHQSANT